MTQEQDLQMCVIEELQRLSEAIDRLAAEISSWRTAPKAPEVSEEPNSKEGT